jgi:hypothetical protein
VLRQSNLGAGKCEHDIKERKNTGEKNWESGGAKTKKSRPEFVLLQKIEKNVWEKLHIDLGFLNKQTTAKYSMVLRLMSELF